MKIQVAGPGCARCQTTEKNVINACAELDLAADILHFTEVIVDGKNVLSGRVSTVGELKTLLTDFKSAA